MFVGPKEQLKEKVRAISEARQYPDLVHQLRQIYLLHADLKGAYYLLFKAIFEIKSFIQVRIKLHSDIGDGLK